MNEAQGDLVRKDEFNTRLTSVWNSVSQAQALKDSVVSLQERVQAREQQLKAAEDEHKELVREVQKLRERLAVLEGRQAAKHSDTR